jgi:hypothetical protein
MSRACRKGVNGGINEVWKSKSDNSVCFKQPHYVSYWPGWDAPQVSYFSCRGSNSALLGASGKKSGGRFTSGNSTYCSKTSVTDSAVSANARAWSRVRAGVDRSERKCASVAGTLDIGRPIWRYSTGTPSASASWPSTPRVGRLWPFSNWVTAAGVIPAFEASVVRWRRFSLLATAKRCPSKSTTAPSATDEPPLLVLLNSCHSASQIQYLVESVAPFAIGMSDSIGDGDAITYATQFYAAVANGQSIFSAHASGQAAVQLAGLPGHDLPTLACADGADPTSTWLVSVSAQ